MALTVTHVKVSSVADDPAADIKPSDWNALHVVADGGTLSLLDLSLSNPLDPSDGGTGLDTYAIGDLLAATGVTTLSRLADVGVGNVLLSGGIGALPSYGKVGLTTHVSGVLPAGNVDLTGVVPTSRTINGFALSANVTLALSDLGGSITVAQGGTGIASYAIGDLLYASASGVLSKLADVAVGSVLVSGGVGVAPAWSATPQVTKLGIGAAADATAVLFLGAASSQLKIRTGASANDTIVIGGTAAQNIAFSTNAGGNKITLTGDSLAGAGGPGRIALSSDSWLTFTNATNGGTSDAGIGRAAAGVVKATDGAGGAGSFVSVFYASPASSTLTITTNTITPTNAIHHLGAGLVKTITVPAAIAATGRISIIPDAAFTTDTTGNISLASTAVIGRTLVFTWDGSKWNPSY